MTSRESFVAAVADHPGDDTTRLVFADWLDDHGESARAEYVRVACGADLLPLRRPAVGWKREAGSGLPITSSCPCEAGGR